LRLAGVRLDQPNGRPLIEAANATVTAGDRVVITGPSGSGKTALLRAIAGAWPFGAGSIEVPAQAHMLFVPQWPYFPLGSLRAVASYPAAEGTFSDERIRELLRLLQLEHLTTHLDDTAPWDQLLSPHEQQRLAIARVLLNEPEWVFLDKATSSLDDETVEQVYALLAARLPRATIISIALAPRVVAHHTRRWTLMPKDHGPSLLQAA
jgi:putative ATP-binding cassette transporter